jgi:EAL domain-containing protein (putative c-di-GMP-specific phosphodiesterase class I)
MAEKRVETEFNEMIYTMKKIINQKDIKLLAQPIIDVATNEIRAWEMLSRGPKGTVLENPMPLFSVARQTGTLYDLEMVVLEKAFRQIIDTGCQKDIFVNCTPLTLGNIRFIADLKSLLKQLPGLSPKQIFFEITERDSIEGLPDLRYNIRILRLMGFRMAVDDTGAGYSSLNTISEILPDIIKIDRSVIEDIDKNSVKESMLKGLLLVAQEAGSQVVAEGIERKEEACVIIRNKVHLAQGYFYARPSILLNNVLS